MSILAKRPLLFGIAAVAAVIVVLILVFPWNILRGALESYASARFDRAVTIGGDLDVRLGWTSRVSIGDLSIANVQWSDQQPMARAATVVLWFTPMGLLRGEPAKAQLVDPNVLLERTAEGDDNWHLGESDPVPRIGNIDVERGVVRVRDAKAPADMTLELQSVAGAGDEAASLRFTGHGTLHGEEVRLEGTSVGLARLQDIDDPYRLTLDVRAGSTIVNFDGTVVPSDTENVRGMLRLRGPDLGRLYPIVPAPLPWTPPYNLAGEVSHTQHLWEFRGMSGVVGASDLKGNVRIDVSKPRSMTTADLTSTRFDSKDLGGFIGLPPGEAAQSASSPSAARRRDESYRVLPDKPLELAKLREHDADIQFRGTSVKWSAFPLDNLVAHLRLQDGVLRFDPLDFGIASGHLVARISVDVTRDIAQAQGEFEARNVELKRLFPKLASPQGTAGRFAGRAHFRTRGNTVAAMLAAADGDAAVIMRGGEASTLQLVLTNLDLARAAELMLRGDETAEIRCAVAALHAKDGVVTPDLFVVDTSAVLITGEGSINLLDEKYDLALNARSKRPSLLALRGPLEIRGTFRAPVVGPAPAPVVARVGAAVGLGLLAPPLALLPLIDFGGASDADCRGLIETARLNTSTTERIARPRAAKTPAPSRPASAREKGGGRISQSP